MILPWNARSGDARWLARHGVGGRLLRQPYAHAKVIMVDGQEAFAGSENLSSTSLDHDREVGVLLSGNAVARLRALFASDWQHARPLETTRAQTESGSAFSQR
jgi:phosphatidylserine/phosphatidylglycerophosphate/cardiolipin synthase-like enzyme